VFVIEFLLKLEEVLFMNHGHLIFILFHLLLYNALKLTKYIFVFLFMFFRSIVIPSQVLSKFLRPLILLINKVVRLCYKLDQSIEFFIFNNSKRSVLGAVALQQIVNYQSLCFYLLLPISVLSTTSTCNT